MEKLMLRIALIVDNSKSLKLDFNISKSGISLEVRRESNGSIEHHVDLTDFFNKTIEEQEALLVLCNAVLNIYELN